jgi:hypothetical protein
MEKTKLQAQNITVNILTNSHQPLFNTLKEINMTLRRTKLDLVFLCLWLLKNPFVASIFRRSSCMFLQQFQLYQ